MKKLLLLIFISVSLFAQIKKGEDIAVPYLAYEIKMGKGFDALQANCLTCHSFGYIINQGPQSKAFWAGKVVKMVVHFKAPITKKDTQTVINYLYKHYGNGKLK
ncbi:MAG: sulfite:cytochrome C oxidoreductase subunit B [Sulfurimonas sp.]|nr:MAG: sulfite:cytochrome C oxidoreductase subunit B [Sulfurimonas sp.]